MKLRPLASAFGALLFLLILTLPLYAASASLPAPSSAETAPNGAAGQDAASPEMPTNQIIIKYRASAILANAAGPASDAQMQRLSNAAGMPLTYFRAMSGGAHVLRLPTRMDLAGVQALAGKLSALPEVEYAEPDAIMQHTLVPNDPRYGDQWHYFAPGSGNYGIDAPGAWDVTTGSASVVVAVIDTGITNHADLSGRTVPGYDLISDTWMANDGDGRDNNPSDPGDWIAAGACYSGSPALNSSWHGTHTAGTIGAASNNGLGVAGVNWNAMIQPVRVLGRCGGTTSDIADGMSWSAGLSVPGAPTNATPAKVLNLSLGGAGVCGATYQNAINAIIGTGATVVVSAGNSNANAAGFRPANCDGVITVAATNRNGSRAYYSNYGNTVEISAPGGETNVSSSNGILSTLNTGTQGPVADTYTFYQGTSMAAPHVAGIASLLYSLNPSITPAQVLSILQSTVTAFPGGSTCNTSDCGSGIVNARKAVEAITPNPAPAIAGLNPTSATAGAPSFTLTVNGTGFVNSSVVRWNGANRTTTFVNATQLTAAINAADIATAGPASVTVFNPAPGGGTSPAATFTVNNPAPTISGLSPSSTMPGGAGFTLTINGAGFVNGSVARWNGSPRTTTYVGPTQLTAAIAAADITSAGTANVTVFNPTPGGGTSSPAIFSIGNPTPTITRLNPPWTAPGGPDFTLTVTGADFVGSSVVRWNGANRATTFVNGGQLTANILAADIAATGTATITVFNPPPVGGLSNVVSFLVGAPRKTYLPVVFKNFPPIPGIPTLSPIDNADGDGNYNVCWTATTNATNYVLEEDDNPSFTSPQTVYNGPVTCWTASNKPTGMYYYRVQGANTWGASGWSNTQSAVVPPGIPLLSPIDNGDGDGNYGVCWTAIVGATSYVLQEADNASFTNPVTVYNGPVTCWAASNKPTGTYYYRAQAVNAWGASGWSNTQSVTVNPANNWTTIVSTDFEGSWPAPWTVYDTDGASYGEYYWGKRTCRVYQGSYSGWGVGAGAQGAGLACGSNYPNYAKAAMDYGPFSLVGATAADLKFKTWFNTEPPGSIFYDYVAAYASIDGTNFYGAAWSGNSGGWMDATLDLSNVFTIGNLLGRPNVWVRLRFRSDPSETYAEGAYVDNIVLRKCLSGTCPTTATAGHPAGSNIVEFPVTETGTP